jgi:branched-chain amino acid aminotransferase
MKNKTLPPASVRTISSSSKTNKPHNLLSSKVYHRDRLVDFKDANLSIASSPMLYGLSIYTVFSVVWDTPAGQLSIFRLRDHYQRLVRSARIMDFHGFEADWPYQRFEATMIELLRANKVRENALVRAAVYIDELAAGTRIHGLKNSLSAYVYPMGEILPRTGVSLGVSSWLRTPDNSIPSRAKVNGSYVNASLMKNEALLNGYDDAIAIDAHGHVAESTVANIFMVQSGVIVTPAGATDILEGITRATLIELARDSGLPVEERSIDRSELYIADEIFLSGSSANVNRSYR